MNKIVELESKAEVSNIETGILQSDRDGLAQGLRGVLADTWVLLVKTQSFHWNVVGPQFFGLHKLTEEQYRDLFASIDMIGERIRALGHPAPQSFNEILDLASVEEREKIATTEEMVQQLAEDNETIARRFRKIANISGSVFDHVTTDMLTKRLQAHEKAAWILRSMLGL